MTSRTIRSLFIATGIIAAGGVSAFGQTPPLVFTTPAPGSFATTVDVRASTVVAERALALWGGSASDFGVGVDLSGQSWTLHSVTSMKTLMTDGHAYPTFDQIEVVRTLFSARSITVAGAGGIRQEWDGRRVLIARALARADVGGGRLQGSVITERAMSSMRRRDGVDVVTTVGWSRDIGHRIALGVEGIGQDLEGFWDATEADGGARLLVGPTIQLRSRSGAWSGTATAGPVMQSRSVFSAGGASSVHSDGHHFGVFASATWLPARR